MNNQKFQHYIQPSWPQPTAIRAFSTTRSIDVSCADNTGVFDSFNLAKHVNDLKQKVRLNRQLLAK
ncbi:MAG: hypothetical protein L3J46_07020, partial [Kangiellaceae bacterium]|nr:hypothetical protein [Kangiellaceae bacterium]